MTKHLMRRSIRAIWHSSRHVAWGVLNRAMVRILRGGRRMLDISGRYGLVTGIARNGVIRCLSDHTITTTIWLWGAALLVLRESEMW